MTLADDMRRAADTLDHVSALYGYTFTALAPWTAEDLRRQAVHVEADVPAGFGVLVDKEPPVMAAEIEAIARAWMLHTGWTEAQILRAEQETHEKSGCERVGDGWNCRNERYGSNHPAWDALREACDMANVAVEALESLGLSLLVDKENP